MPKINVVDMAGKVVSELELNENVFGIEPNKTAMLRCSQLPRKPASGYSVHTYQNRGKRRRQKALETEGYRSCKTGFHKISSVETRWYRPRPEAPFLQIHSEQEGKKACNALRSFR